MELCINKSLAENKEQNTKTKNIFSIQVDFHICQPRHSCLANSVGCPAEQLLQSINTIIISLQRSLLASEHTCIYNACLSNSTPVKSVIYYLCMSWLQFARDQPSTSLAYPDGFIYIALELKSTLHLLLGCNELRVSTVVAIVAVVVIVCLPNESCNAKKCKQNNNINKNKHWNRHRDNAQTVTWPITIATNVSNNL